MNEPIDDLHQQILIERDEIKRRFDQAKEAAALWEPQPMPTEPRYARSDEQKGRNA